MSDHMSFDPSQHPVLLDTESDIIKRVTKFAREYFQNPKFDCSHDFNHVMRVTSNAIHILNKEQFTSRLRVDSSPYGTQMSAFVVIVGALLHDVDDRKYQDKSASNAEPLALQELLRLGLGRAEAQRIQDLIDGVSYSSESKNPERTKALIRDIPELAVVQDADRLDAIGAIGIGRCFTYGGAKEARSLQDSIDHFTDKLLKLEGMMKTETGKQLAAERSKRIREFMSWWDTETAIYNH